MIAYYTVTVLYILVCLLLLLVILLQQGEKGVEHHVYQLKLAVDGNIREVALVNGDVARAVFCAKSLEHRR